MPSRIISIQVRSYTMRRNGGAAGSLTCRFLARLRTTVGIASAVCVQAGCRGPAHASPAHEIDVVVDESHVGGDGARVDGVPTYRTIGAALAAAPTASDVPYVVRILRGRYREKLSVDKPNVRFIGESRD